MLALFFQTNERKHKEIAEKNLVFLTLIVVVNDVFCEEIIVAEDNWRVDLREVLLQ